MNVKLKNVVVFVTDIAAAKKFYQEGLQLPLIQESQMALEFFSGGPTLGVALALSDEAQKLVGRHTGITLAVEEIDAVCAGLAASGVRFTEPLEKGPWGKMAVVADPDGNQFALVGA